MKLLSADTCLEAQLFLVQRLREMPAEKRLRVAAAAIAAGLGLRNPELRAMDPFEIAARVTELLEALEVEYFLGGSLASTVYGEPRFTQDVDIVVRLDQTRATGLASQLRSEFYVSEVALEEAVLRRGSANLIHLGSNFKIDLIQSSDSPFECSEFERRTRLAVGERSFYFCSPEDIILAKLDWYRKSAGILDRQLRDIQTVMMVQSSLDRDYLRRWSDELGLRQQLEASLMDAGL